MEKIRKPYQAPTITRHQVDTKMNILKVVILAEFDDNKVRQVLVDENMIRKFLTGVAFQNGALKVLEHPIEGVTLEKVDN